MTALKNKRNWKQFREFFGFVSDLGSITGITLLWLKDSLKLDPDSMDIALAYTLFILIISFFMISATSLTAICVMSIYRIVVPKKFLYELCYFSFVGSLALIAFFLGGRFMIFFVSSLVKLAIFGRS